jgi:uncharacterized protein YjiS (DUF1127 family)
MTLTSVETLQSRSSALARAPGVISRATRTVLIWLERRRDREILAALDDRMLRDIGISRADVEREYTKPFWRI